MYKYMEANPRSGCRVEAAEWGLRRVIRQTRLVIRVLQVLFFQKEKRKKKVRRTK
jgi:hypothetical protein